MDREAINAVAAIRGAGANAMAGIPSGYSDLHRARNVRLSIGSIDR